MSDLVPLSTLYQRVGVEPCPQRLRLLKAEGDLLQDMPVRAPHEDAHLVQPRQVVGHGLEAADEEVADGDVGPRGVAQHLLQPRQQRRVGRGVEDVQWFTPTRFSGPALARSASGYW